jgi:two-component system sensor histidine kinase/response regulator
MLHFNDLGAELHVHLQIARRSLSMNKIRVLVAEDDEVNAKAARTMLEQLGCSVDVATNGTEAVDHFRERDYDLILMDWQMPLMNGIEATARIRSMPGGIGTPIVGTTAGKAHEECLKGGMNDVVPKPFLFDKMRYVLSRWTRWTGAPISGPCQA